MAPYFGLLPREGLTADPVARFISRTALNPAFTLIFILLARYTKQGSDLSILHEKSFSGIKKLFYLGLAKWASAYLDRGVLNNWTSDKYDWDKEIVLVTGGARGIGSEIVKTLVDRKKGLRVVVLDVAEKMSFEAGPNVHYYKCDITSLSTLSTIGKQIRDEVGNPTILIANAGVANNKSILTTTPTDLGFTFGVNTFSHYYLAQTFLPSIIESNHGMVVTVASLAAYMTVPNMTSYGNSKAAALSYHEGLTAELSTIYNAPKVRTVLVTQGYTKTPLFEGWGGKGLIDSFLMPALETQTVAEGIVNQVLSGKSGQLLFPGVGGGIMPFCRGMPHWYQVRARAQGEGLMKGWKGKSGLDIKVWEKQQQQQGDKEDKDSKDSTGVSNSTVLVPLGNV